MTKRGSVQSSFMNFTNEFYACGDVAVKRGERLHDIATNGELHKYAGIRFFWKNIKRLYFTKSVDKSHQSWYNNIRLLKLISAFALHFGVTPCFAEILIRKLVITGCLAPLRRRYGLL